MTEILDDPLECHTTSLVLAYVVAPSGFELVSHNRLAPDVIRLAFLLATLISYVLLAVVRLDGCDSDHITNPFLVYVVPQLFGVLAAYMLGFCVAVLLAFDCRQFLMARMASCRPAEVVVWSLGCLLALNV